MRTYHVYARCNLPHGVCPYCGHVSRSVHSRYHRTIADLSIIGHPVIITFEARKFFCHNPDCRKKTFAEQPGDEVFRYRRRTRRCEMAVTQHGLKCSSESARKLLSATGVPLSGDTVLRDVHRMSVPERCEVKEIGVDDWAFRKGVTYGSIIVSRDRSTDYTAAIAATGRNITEVADRFHLNMNMSDCVTKVIGSHYDEYRSAVRPEEVQETPEVDSDKSIRKEKMVHAEVALVEKMMSYGWFRDIYNAASSFYATIMGNDIDELDSWLDSYGKSPIKELRSFAYGIRMDLKAVRNAITLDTSNGIVEGFVNKLKAVKRVMFGRASLDLLKRKMVFSDLCFN